MTSARAALSAGRNPAVDADSAGGELMPKGSAWTVEYLRMRCISGASPPEKMALAGYNAGTARRQLELARASQKKI